MINLMFDDLPKCSYLQSQTSEKPLKTDIQQLPILKVMPEIQAALARGSAVLAAPPGTGKTALVPLALLNEKWLQNRKI